MGSAAIRAAAVGPPASVLPPEGRACRGIGRGFAAYPLLAALPGLELDPKHSRTLPDARDFARLGALRFALGEACDAAELTPLYLRDKVALTEAKRRCIAAAHGGLRQAPKCCHGTVTYHRCNTALKIQWIRYT